MAVSQLKTQLPMKIDRLDEMKVVDDLAVVRPFNQDLIDEPTVYSHQAQHISKSNSMDMIKPGLRCLQQRFQDASMSNYSSLERENCAINEAETNRSDSTSLFLTNIKNSSRIQSRARIRHNKLTLQYLAAHNEGDKHFSHKTQQQVEILNSIEESKLIRMLYESLDYQWETDKRSLFQYMKELVDQIYGVDFETVKNVDKRYFISQSAPKNFELKSQLN